jgi:hypothetical protein
MKKIIYISILVFFVSSSFVKEKSLKDILIGNCWVNKSFESDYYVKRLAFNPKRHGFRFINEKEIILFQRHHWCGNAKRTQKLGEWDVLNDSTITIRHKDYKESIISIEYRIRKKNNRKIEFEFLTLQERKRGDNPKPFLD